MGLDITAYRNLQPVTDVDVDEGENWRKFVRFGASMEWTEEIWPGRGAPLDSQAVYSWAERFDFRAGSYSGYNAWREALRTFAAGLPKRADGSAPFGELVDFADNEGTIGPIVSAKLATDFDANPAAAVRFARESLVESQWFIGRFGDWGKAFVMASDGGAVDFH